MLSIVCATTHILISLTSKGLCRCISLRSVLFFILSSILNWLGDGVVEHLRRPDVLKLFLTAKIKVLLAFFHLSICFAHFFVVKAEVFAASTFFLQHFLLWIELSTAVLQPLRDLVKYLGRLVLKLSLLKEAHEFFFGFGDLNVQLLVCIGGQLNPVLLQDIDYLLKLGLALINMLSSMQHILAFRSISRVRRRSLTTS